MCAAYPRVANRKRPKKQRRNFLKPIKWSFVQMERFSFILEPTMPIKKLYFFLRISGNYIS